MADSRARTRSGITVVGTGTASSPVDHVTITLGVEARRADPGDAFRVAATTATELLALLADHGIDSRAVRTSNLSLGPEWDYRDGHNERVGYQARQDLTVTVEGLAGVDRMLTDVVNRAGEGVSIGGISLDSADSAAALARAREVAFADAAAAAGQLARLAGRALGPVERIDEGSPEVRPGRRVHKVVAFSASGADSMPIAGGDASVSVSLIVRYSFAD